MQHDRNHHISNLLILRQTVVYYHHISQVIYEHNTFSTSLNKSFQTKELQPKR